MSWGLEEKQHFCSREIQTEVECQMNSNSFLVELKTSIVKTQLSYAGNTLLGPLLLS